VNKAAVMLGRIYGVALLLYGFVQTYAAFAGYSEWSGAVSAIGLIALTFIIGPSVLLITGAFYYAHHVRGWHWALSALFAAPMLVALLPSLAPDALNFFSGRRKIG
jgi:hypothetical protein